jgi:hypothetical protein
VVLAWVGIKSVFGGTNQFAKIRLNILKADGTNSNTFVRLRIFQEKEKIITSC